MITEVFSFGVEAENVFAFPFDYPLSFSLLTLLILRYFNPFCDIQFLIKVKILLLT